MRYRLARHGATFATRARGAEVRADIESAVRQTKPDEMILLDFEGVEVISFSFADEVVGHLLADRSHGDLAERAILVTNANEDVVDSIVSSLGRRGLVGARLFGGAIDLLNAPIHLRETFAALRQRGQARTADVAADLGLGLPACNNRLKPLVSAGIVVRTAAVQPTGGREYIYRVVSLAKATTDEMVVPQELVTAS